MLTVKEAAELVGAGETSIRLWARQGKFPGARQEETPFGSYWIIPESALDGFEKRNVGRPPKPVTTKGNATPAHKKGASK